MMCISHLFGGVPVDYLHMQPIVHMFVFNAANNGL